MTAPQRNSTLNMISDLGARGPVPMPDGWAHEDAFISDAQERQLLQVIADLPLRSAQYKEWTAKRRIVSYGGRYDFSRNVLDPAEPIPPFLTRLRDRAAQWCGMPCERLSHATIAEYRSGTQLGWHRDVPEFDVVAGVSLLGHARMRFRPYPHHKGQRTVFTMELAPRSIYAMRGSVRWEWQHAISPTEQLRYSITFRSRRAGAAATVRGRPLSA